MTYPSPYPANPNLSHLEAALKVGIDTLGNVFISTVALRNWTRSSLVTAP